MAPLATKSKLSRRQLKAARRLRANEASTPSTHTKRNQRSVPRPTHIQVGGPAYKKRYSKGELRHMVQEAESSTFPPGSFDVDPAERLVMITAPGHRDAISYAVNVSKPLEGSQPRLVFFADGSVIESLGHRGIGVVYKRLDGPEADWRTKDWIYDGYGLGGEFKVVEAEVLALYCALKVAYMEVASWIKKHENHGTSNDPGTVSVHKTPRVMIHTDCAGALDYMNIIHQGYDVKNDTMPLHLRVYLLDPLNRLRQLGAKVDLR